jgi:hypothetical protein
VFMGAGVGCLIAVAITKWLGLGGVGSQFIDGLRGGYHADLLVEDEKLLLPTY